MAHRIVGKPIGRLDGIEKVSGEARYSGERDAPRAGLGESPPEPVASRADPPDRHDQAKALAGVLAVLTARDLPNILVGRRMFDMPLLARERVRFIGERSAVVAALDPDIAKKLWRSSTSSTRISPPSRSGRGDQGRRTDPAREPRGVRRSPPERPHPNVQSVLRFKLGRRGGWVPSGRPGLRATPSVRSSTIRAILEPHAGESSDRRQGGRVQVWASNKMPFRLKELLSAGRYSFPPAQIRSEVQPF